MCSITTCGGLNHEVVQVQVIAKANVAQKNGFKARPPTVLLQFNKDFEVGKDGAEAGGSGSQVQTDGRAGNSEKGRLVSPSKHNIKHHETYHPLDKSIHC